MKVVHIITGLGQGGAETMLEKLVVAARSANPEITHEVISLGAVGDIGQRLADAGVQVRALGLVRSAGLFWALLRLVRWLRATGPSPVVQTWMYHADLIGGLAARLAGHPDIVWNIRQTGLELRDIGRSTRGVVRACAWLSRRLPSRIVCNASAAIAAHAAQGYDVSRFEVIPNGFDVRRWSRRAQAGGLLRSAWGIRDDEVAVGLVARYDAQKDFGNFVAMAAIVAAELPSARFVLVGRGIRESQELANAVACSGLSKRFVLEGQRADIPEVMSALDVFCLSSRAEGFPNVLGEAMACETPSVSTDAGDARRIVGDDLLIAPVERSDALAACVLRVLRRTPVERRQLGAQQRRRIESEFDIERIWQRYRELYCRLQRQTMPASFH